MVETLLKELGVKPLINAAATQTPLGGSRMNPSVSRAMDEASRYFLDLRQLHRAVGGRIARLTNNEDAMVSGGVASAFYLVTMALLSLNDPQAFALLPQQQPSEHSMVIYQTHCVEYTIGIEQAGVRLRRIDEQGTVDADAGLLETELAREKPLAVFYVLAGPWIKPGAPPLETVIQVCQRHGVPVIVDAAAQLPPKSNFWRFTQMGADLALFSGGKDLRGPSHIGLVLGRHDLVDACRSLISPNEGVGRFFKIGKEELLAALVAVEDYMVQDEAARLSWCEKEVEKLVRGLSDVKCIEATRAYPNEAGQPLPRVFVRLLKTAGMKDAREISEDFLHRETPIAFLADSAKGGFYINPMTLAPGESEKILLEIQDYFNRNQSPMCLGKTERMIGP